MYSTHKPQPRADYRLEQIDGELLLYHPGRTIILYCNASASLIWQLCDGQRTVAEIVTLLRQAYPENADALAADVEATLQQFTARGAIELV